MKNKKNPAASVYNRLLALAKETKRPFDELLTYYAIERFLCRMSQSKYANQFILKGALLFHVWNPKVSRATRDIDFLGYFKNEIKNIEKNN